MLGARLTSSKGARRSTKSTRFIRGELAYNGGTGDSSLRALEKRVVSSL